MRIEITRWETATGAHGPEKRIAEHKIYLTEAEIDPFPELRFLRSNLFRPLGQGEYLLQMDNEALRVADLAELADRIEQEEVKIQEAVRAQLQVQKSGK